jgi:hypothetical protein
MESVTGCHAEEAAVRRCKRFTDSDSSDMRSISSDKAKQRFRRSRQIKTAGSSFDLKFK